MKTVLRVHHFEERLTPAVAIDSAHEAYSWVLINNLRQDPTGFANNLQGLVNGTVHSAFGFAKSDPVITDLKGLINRASVPGHYGETLALMRATPATGPLAWDETLETRAGTHNDWMRVNGFAHTGTSGNRSPLPGYSSNNNAPTDTWGYTHFSSWGENIGWAVGSMQTSKAAYAAGGLSLSGLQQRAAFLDTVGYMLELNSGSLGHLENLLGRDSGFSGSLPSFNVIGTDIDLYEAPGAYEETDGIPEAWVSTHRLGLYRPTGSGGFVAGIAFQDGSANDYFDAGEGAQVTVDVRDAAGNGFTDNLGASNFGAFSGFVPNGTYTVTASVAGVALTSRMVTVSNSNAWAELNIAGVGRTAITGPVGVQAGLRPAVTWTSVEGASSYQVRIDDQALLTTNIFPNSVTTDTSWTPPGDMVSGRAYRVWVRAMRGTSPGPWSESQNFTIAVPTKGGPTGAVANLRPTFSWSGIGGATSYALRINDLSAKLTNLFPNLTPADTNWSLPADLVSGRNYSWQVRAVNATGLGAWSPAGTFAVARPNTTGPATGVTAVRPFFTWTPVIGASSYVVIVNDVSANRPALYTARVTDTNWVPPADLVSGRTYSWQVRAVNAAGWGGWSPLATFAVGRAVAIGPFGPVSGPRPTFIWAGVTGAGQYQVRVDDLTAGKASLFLATVPDQAWTPGVNLTTGHVYRWWVRAVSPGGFGAWSISKDLRIV